MVRSTPGRIFSGIHSAEPTRSAAGESPLNLFVPARSTSSRVSFARFHDPRQSSGTSMTASVLPPSGSIRSRSCSPGACHPLAPCPLPYATHPHGAGSVPAPPTSAGPPIGSIHATSMRFSSAIDAHVHHSSSTPHQHDHRRARGETNLDLPVGSWPRARSNPRPTAPVQAAFPATALQQIHQMPTHSPFPVSPFPVTEAPVGLTRPRPRYGGASAAPEASRRENRGSTARRCPDRATGFVYIHAAGSS
jgi:hypothetical protein